MKVVVVLFLSVLVISVSAEIRARRQFNNGQSSSVVTPDGGVIPVPTGSQVVHSNGPDSGIQTYPNQQSGFSQSGGGDIPAGSVIVTPGRRVRRQIVTGQSAVATPGGGIVSVPAGSQVVDPSAPVPGIQTDPLRSSVVSLPGGGLTNIPPGSKIATPGK